MGPSSLPSLDPGGRFAEWEGAVPRLVLSDVDGTLIGPTRTPTAAVSEAVGTARAAGLRVGLATGREWAGIARLVDELPLDGPHVLHNGAEVRDAGTVVERWPLRRELARDLVALATQRQWYAELYVDDGFVVTDVRAPARAHRVRLEATPEGTVGDLDLEREVVVKATVIVFDEAVLDATLLALAAIGANAAVGFSPLTPALRYVNVTRPDVDKGRALRAAAAHAGVQTRAVAALGDGLNDLPLFAAAGTAVAMGQAPAEVRAAAHFVAPSALSDGAAAALHTLVGLTRVPAAT